MSIGSSVGLDGVNRSWHKLPTKPWEPIRRTKRQLHEIRNNIGAKLVPHLRGNGMRKVLFVFGHPELEVQETKKFINVKENGIVIVRIEK